MPKTWRKSSAAGWGPAWPWCNHKRRSHQDSAVKKGELPTASASVVLVGRYFGETVLAVDAQKAPLVELPFFCSAISVCFPASLSPKCPPPLTGQLLQQWWQHRIHSHSYSACRQNAALEPELLRSGSSTCYRAHSAVVSFDIRSP